MLRIVLPLCLTLAACGAQTVPLLQAPSQQQVVPRSGLPLEVHTSSMRGQDPAVHGSSFVFSDVEQAIGRAVTAATAPWAEAHRGGRAGGWQLLVEFIRSQSRVEDGRLHVEFGVRATLYGVVGRVYLGQTQANCHSSGAATDANAAGELAWQCITGLGHDLAGWLQGLPIEEK